MEAKMSACSKCDILGGKIVRSFLFLYSLSVTHVRSYFVVSRCLQWLHKQCSVSQKWAKMTEFIQNATTLGCKTCVMRCAESSKLVERQGEETPQTELKLVELWALHSFVTLLVPFCFLWIGFGKLLSEKTTAQRTSRPWVPYVVSHALWTPKVNHFEKVSDISRFCKARQEDVHLSMT